jgi:hypothetical protein
MQAFRNILLERKYFVALLMESPLYFTVPLKNRLHLIKKREERFLTNGTLNQLLNQFKEDLYYSNGD